MTCYRFFVLKENFSKGKPQTVMSDLEKQLGFLIWPVALVLIKRR